VAIATTIVSEFAFSLQELYVVAEHQLFGIRPQTDLLAYRVRHRVPPHLVGIRLGPIVGRRSPAFRFLEASTGGVKTDPDRRLIQLRMDLKEAAIAPAKCLKHEWKLALKNAGTHASAAKNEPAADVAEDMQRWPAVALLPFGQYLVALQASVPAYDW
jgi:hypothetical protein